MKRQSKIDIEDTIAAISTPLGEGAIGIIRLSGNDAVKIADNVFCSKKRRAPSTFSSFTSHLGHILDGGLIVDEALLMVMRAPKSYTKEDMVEIGCHGGPVPLRKTLGLLLKFGARLAEPGEFTKRAFLNGRIDLTQAEAVLDIIRSKTDTSLKIALGQLDGRLSSDLNGIKDELISISANIEASIDFPEDDTEIMSEGDIARRLKSARGSLSKLLETSDQGIIMREGISCVICGKPNVGKSSLLNAILRKDRAIVTHIPGTTRDTIEEFVNIGGAPFKLVDTAGIASTENIVEREGILRSRARLEGADLILLLLDSGSKMTDEDRILLDETKGRPRIIVLNKIDLPKKISIPESAGETVIGVSAKEAKGIEALEKAMRDAVFSGKLQPVPEGAMVTNVRQKEALRSASESLERADKAVEDKLSPELIAIELKESLDCIGSVVGEVATDDILDRVFSKFCIGK